MSLSTVAVLVAGEVRGGSGGSDDGKLMSGLEDGSDGDTEVLVWSGVDLVVVVFGTEAEGATEESWGLMIDAELEPKRVSVRRCVRRILKP